MDAEKYSLKKKGRVQPMLSGVAVPCAALLPLGQGLADVALTLVDGQNAPVSEPVRWQLEEDNTDLTVPGVHANNTASLVIHKSHAPFLANGEITTAAPFTSGSSGYNQRQNDMLA